MLLRQKSKDGTHQDRTDGRILQHLYVEEKEDNKLTLTKRRSRKHGDIQSQKPLIDRETEEQKSREG